MHGLITLPFGDGEYDFRLTLAGLAEVEAKFDKSIFRITAELQMRSAKSSEISEVIRVGLVGGGKTPVDALVLVRRYVDERPLDESRDVAYSIALAGLARVHSKELADDVGEPIAPEIQSGSTSAPSSDLQP